MVVWGRWDLTRTYRAVKRVASRSNSYLDTEEGKALKDIYPEKCGRHLMLMDMSTGKRTLPYNTDFVYYVNKELADNTIFLLEQLAGLQPSELEDILDIVYQGKRQKIL